MVSPLSAAIGLSAAAAYLAGAVVQTRSLRRKLQVNATLLIALSLIGLVLHGVVNYLVIYSDRGINLGLATSASLVAWIMLAFVLLTNLRLPVQNLLILVLPLALIAVVLLVLGANSNSAPLAHLSDPLIAHILISIVAYSILFMAACQSVLLGILERRLKTHQTNGLVRVMPPLQTMEAMLFNLLWAGIGALTLAIASGFLFLENLFEQRVVHHTVLTLASWLLYAVLLVGHRLLGWRGTTAVRWSLIAFALLVLGYFGTKFVIEILLDG